jgi:hypothetical protein
MTRNTFVVQLEWRCVGPCGSATGSKPAPPGADGIRFFSVVTDSKAKHVCFNAFEHCLIFEGKAMSLPQMLHLSICKYPTRLVKVVRNKRTSLFWYPLK